MSFILSTTLLDIKDGYAEFSMEVETEDQFSYIVDLASTKGIPSYRLSVMEFDEESDEYEYLGSLEGLMS